MIDMGDQDYKIIQQTKTICPECLMELKGFMVRTDKKVYLKRNCPVHGEILTAISNNSDRFEDLLNYYKGLNLTQPQDRQKKQYTIFYTNRCNIDCPICFMNANFKGNIQDPSNAALGNFLNAIKRAKINIFGGEPTIRGDLPELIALIKKTGNLSALFTNGINISRIEYLKTLKQSGLNEVHLQFDGFNEKTDLKFRNISLLENKLSALENTRILDIPVVFEVTIDEAMNTQEIPSILKHAFSDWHIRGICFRSYCALGRRGVEIKKLTIEDLVAAVETNSIGAINTKDILVLQKLIYIMAEWCNFDWCFSHRYMIIYRRKNKRPLGIGEIFNFKTIDRRLENYVRYRKKSRIFAKIYFIFAVLPRILTLRGVGTFMHLIKVIIAAKFFSALTQSSFKSPFLIIDFESPCDRFTFDLDKICNTKVIGEDLKVHSSFYMASLEKERFFQHTA